MTGAAMVGGRRQWQAWVTVMVAVAALVAGCGRTGDVPPGPPQARVAVQPGPGSPPVGPSAPVGVTAGGGQLREVTLTPAGGAPVPGTLSPDRTRWAPAAPLDYATTYTWGGSAVDRDGRIAPVTGTFSTLRPAKLARATLNITDGQTVGVAAPILLQFKGHVADKAAVERALTVTTSVPTEGGWGWMQDELGGSRAFYRTKDYWAAGTQVSVTGNLYGLDLGGGTFGAGNVATHFTVGRARITKADITSHQLVVVQDGQPLATYDASYGKESDPERNTHSGIHVITEKFTDKRMVNADPKYHYDEVEHWAVRMSNNGEFIHANPATVGVQGSANVSHGCVNLSTADAKAYYDAALYGDPVEVTGSSVPLSSKDGDIWAWTLDWPTWQSLSALHRTN
jgi:lipoprotein-anchoring transpeptidase ErfK/SrfK